MVVEDVERLIVIREMMCRKLMEPRKRRVGAVTLSELCECGRSESRVVLAANCFGLI